MKMIFFPLLCILICHVFSKEQTKRPDKILLYIEGDYEHGDAINPTNKMFEYVFIKDEVCHPNLIKSSEWYPAQSCVKYGQQLYKLSYCEFYFIGITKNSELVVLMSDIFNKYIIRFDVTTHQIIGLKGIYTIMMDRFLDSINMNTLLNKFLNPDLYIIHSKTKEDPGFHFEVRLQDECIEERLTIINLFNCRDRSYNLNPCKQIKTKIPVYSENTNKMDELNEQFDDLHQEETNQ